MNGSEILTDTPDFSLVLGGPLFQLYRRAHLSGDAGELARRRILAITSIAWLPLLVLSLIGGQALGGGINIPFLYDIDAHSRFLIALPILVAAELVVHSRLRPAVNLFVERRLVLPEDMPKFNSAVDSAMRVRNSAVVEVGLLILVYTVGLWLWRSQIASGIASWYAMGDASGWHLTLAGYWYAFVSIPIFQFILLRWYLRFLIWFVFLWRVSRLKLRLIATHPDRSAGLGFLGQSSYAFTPILFAQGVLLAGLIANRVLFEGKDLLSFKMDAAGLIIFFLVFIFSPLLAFSAQLNRAKRRGLSDYGGLACRYVQGFEGKWITTNASGDEELLGTGDIQSLADLGNSFGVVVETRPVPFGVKDVSRLAAAAAAPLLPLALMVMPVQELAGKLLKILL